MAKKNEGGDKLSSQEAEALEGPLRLDLLDVQSQLMDADFPVLVVLSGLEPTPANEVLNALFAWLDPRFLRPHALRKRTKRERREPFLRRYWKRLPGDGRIGIFLGGWILDAYNEVDRGHVSRDRFTRNLAHIQRMEGQLVAEGSHLIKIWIGAEPKLDSADPAMRLLIDTDNPYAEWHVVDTPHSRNRRLACGRIVADSIRERLKQGPPALPAADLPPVASAPLLTTLDMTAALSKEDYEERKDVLQARLAKLSARCAKKKIGSVCALEGWDAAGKGGAIRRLTGAMDARNYYVIPIAAPSPEELRRPYLWRFWLNLPRPGSMALFDRTWYGRVLVERIEGFAERQDWRRAYDEINDFEEQWIEKGFSLSKFWVHIGADEQLRRFEEREKEPYKQYKITPDDYRNRAKRAEYEVACEEMLARTSTPTAPWTLVPANDKYFARILILETLCKDLERVLDR